MLTKHETMGKKKKKIKEVEKRERRKEGNKFSITPQGRILEKSGGYIGINYITPQ